MSQLNEIKCPVCEKWSESTGKIDEKCSHCDAYLEPGRLHYAEEIRIKTENNRKNSYLIIKQTDDPIMQILKEFVNWLRWGAFYGISVIYVVIAVMVVVYGLIML